MTWVVGASSLFGYGALVSDIQVTFGESRGEQPRRENLLRKIYDLGGPMGCGFSGSVKVGFGLVDSLRTLLRERPQLLTRCGWDPLLVAQEWAPIAKSIFFAPSNTAERKHGSAFLIVGLSPHLQSGGPGFPKVHVIRFASPDFIPRNTTAAMAIRHIGSGARVKAYKDAVRPLLDPRTGYAVPLEMHGVGMWADSIGRAMSRAINELYYPGIGQHMHIFGYSRSGNVHSNNDEEFIMPVARSFKMPPVATSYEELMTMADALRCNAASATC